jgi:hypothetical protein
MQRGQLLVFLFLSFFVKSVNMYLEAGSLNIPAIIGGGLGLFLFPFVFAFVAKGVAGLFIKGGLVTTLGATSKAFQTTYLIFWMLFAVSGFVVLYAV